MQPKKMEQYKYFQPIAWTLCLSFAGFVGMMALNLQVTVQNMQANTVSMESRLNNIEEAVGVKPI